MIPTLLVILVYIVGPIAILTWAVKRYRHGVKPAFGEVVVVVLAMLLMVLFAFTTVWNTSDDDKQEVTQIVQELTERYDFPVKARFADRPAVEGIAKPRRLELHVYGVITSEEQAKVVMVLEKLHRQIASKPIVVHFIRAEVWEENADGSRQPRRDREELMRQVRIE
ncbi:hypothetical protein JYT26_00855 [Beggiatoa alba]|nr:hypothetical protein [Beggiatoa alba]